MLEERLAKNINFQKIDLVEWIFDKTEIMEGSNILEFCCGVGTQTLHLANLAGVNGHIFALDVSREALEKLSGKIEPGLRKSVTIIESEMDVFHIALKNEHISPPYFDLIFCSYGLYYSNNLKELLKEAKSWLKPTGKFVVIGPFGPNNNQVYDFLEKGEVIIPDSVKYVSSEFMHSKAIPWFSKHFETVNISTVVNEVRWEAPGEFITYWKNSTFYDPKKKRIIEELLDEHFKNFPSFINEKWVIMIEAKNMRS